MTVNLFEYKGSVTVFVSWTTLWPGPEDHDKVFTTKCFLLSESSSEFEAEQVFLAVFADSECEYEIQVEFGKIFTFKGKKGKSEEESFNDSISPEINKTRNKRGTVKNFIRANRKALSPAAKFKDVENEWIKKRAEAVLRKKTLVQEKRFKTIENLNKQAYRAEFNEIIRKERENIDAFECFLKKIISFVYFLGTVNKIRTLIKVTREHKLKRIEKNLKMSRIQKCVKQKILPPDLCPLALATRCLVFYRKTVNHIFLLQTEKLITDAIIQKANENLIIHRIRSFGLKVLRIQRLCSRGFKIRSLQMKRLDLYWLYCVELLMSKKNLNKQHKRMALDMKYKGIPVTARARVLKVYYLECWKAFREEIRKVYSENQKTSMPYFKYMPTETKMKEMIQSLLKRN